MRSAVLAAATALLLAGGPGVARAQSSDGFPKLAFLQKISADRLAETGLDTPRFLRGLLFQFAGDDERRELYPWRLSRAMIEAGEEERFEALLTGVATNEHNRFRATETLAYLWARSGTDRKAAFEKIAAVDGLSPISAAWAKRMAANAASAE